MPSPCRASRDGVDRLHRRHRVALDARHLHQPADGVAREAEVVLERDLGGVLHLLGRAAHHLGQTGRGHRARRADLALAADLGAGDAGVHLEQRADGAGGEQEATTPSSSAPGTKCT